MAKRNIVWLASYPKSGNTWVRLFLANYLLNRDAPVSINEIHRIALGDSLLAAYQRVARRQIDARDERAVLDLRKRVLIGLSGDADISLVKTHNQNTVVGGYRLIAPELTRLAVYIVRNPLDMLISYAHHYGMSCKLTAEAISAPGNHIVADANNVVQYLGTWSDHVRGWRNTRDFPVMTMRYEDMIERPLDEFRRLLSRMKVPIDDDRLERAIRFSSFDEARGQEDDGGFRERSRHAERFFRAGTAGQWRDLPSEVVDRVVECHQPAMKQLGYLP